jgi:hypothetical protein
MLTTVVHDEISGVAGGDRPRTARVSCSGGSVERISARTRLSGTGSIET